MALYETESLILRNYDLADADKIVVFLTKSEGLIRGVAKGAKRLKSKFGGSLEPFSIVNVTYFQKDQSELVSIRNIDLQRSYFKDAIELNFLQKFAYLADLLVEFAPPNDPNERLYNMAKVCLETTSSNKESIESIALYFELWILRLGGYLPSWELCNNCNNIFQIHDSANLQYDFHLYCNSCQKTQQRYVINSTQRQIFNLALKCSPKKFSELTKNNLADIKEVSNVQKRLISNVLGKEVTVEKTITGISN